MDLEMLARRRIVACPESLDVKCIRNMPYNRVNGTDYNCDLYLPPWPLKTGEKLPVVILVHGEAPAPGLKDIGQYMSLGEYIASGGMAAVTFDHRMLVGGTGIQEILDDIRKIREYVESCAERYDLDAERVCIWAVSSGMVYGLQNAMHYRPEAVRCAVGYYGFGDLKTLLTALSITSDNAQQIPEIINGTPGFPVMIVRSGLDHKFINGSLDGFIMKCLESNMRVNVHNHSTGNHAFDILDDNPESHHLIESTLKFIKENLVTQQG